MGFKIAVFSLNQWTLDFAGNTSRILKSILEAKKENASYRVGPELELCGYSLEDAFFEDDTVHHCWDCLIEILGISQDLDMIIDVGMPVRHSSLYNCRVIIYNGRIMCIRAKTSLAQEGIYREERHFAAWDPAAGITAYCLPKKIRDTTGQQCVPFGANFVLELPYADCCDTFKIGWDICQELWDVKNVSSDLYHNFGCHLIINSSGSYWELRKLNTVLDMVKGISMRSGACYAFSNLVGCDGQRFVFYGRSCVFNKGELVAMSSTYSKMFEEVQVTSYSICPREINEYRSQMAIKPDRSSKANLKVLELTEKPLSSNQINNSYNRLFLSYFKSPRNQIESLLYTNKLIDTSIRFQDEINLYVPLWLWDYLRRSGMMGFMIPLSGGLDSSTVATLVYSMSNHLFRNLESDTVINYFVDVHKISRQDYSEQLESPEMICKRLLKCAYLSTKYSSDATRRRARLLSESIGAEFIDLSLQSMYANFKETLAPQSDPNEVSLLDQNLQARMRMTATYYLSGGNRIVLATGNVDESIMGYLTKYDCSSADINPIGGLCKDDLKSYLKYCCGDLFKANTNFVDIVEEIIQAPPSAELTGQEQRDEDEIGVTYDEISVLGRVRRGIYGCSGPMGAFETVWRHRDSEPFCSKIRCLVMYREGHSNITDTAVDLAKLIKQFYSRYAKNRHKLTVLTPALHAETYSPDDNRYDHRHFLYAPWKEQFDAIDLLVRQISYSNIQNNNVEMGPISSDHSSDLEV